MSEFHQSPAWLKLSKDFKTLKCVDCGKSEDIQAGHILPASRFKMSRLWKSNLVAQCAACNAKLGNKIRWSIQAIKLLGIYGAMKTIQYLFIAALIGIIFLYGYYDITKNSSTITDQIRADVYQLIKEAV